MLDLEGLLKPIDAAAPSGPDLRYSPEYAELDRALAGKPERVLGNSVVAAEPPDWRTARDKASALLASTKDLRIGVALARALLEIDGLAGFGDGLALVRQLVEQFWDTLHPQLDAEDDNDPTARVSAMAELTHRDVIQALRSVPLITSRAFGPVSLKVIDAALAGARAPAPAAGNGTAAPAPTAATIEAAFQEATTEALAQALAAVTRCADEARTLAEKWAERLPGTGPDFTEFRRVIAQAQQAVKARMDQRQDAPGAAQAPSPDGASAAGAPAPRPRTLAEIDSREDVLRAIDAICAYYARHEPSSPVPLLLQRSKRLVTMSFMDILKEMVPDSIESVQKITGHTD